MTHLFLAGLLCIAAAQESQSPPSIIDHPEPTTFTTAPDTPPGPKVEVAADPLKTALQNMTLHQRVAQLMAVTMAGSHQPTAADLDYLKSYTPGIVIVRKILKPAYAAHYVTKLRTIERFSGIPLWVGTNIYRLTKAERNGLNEFVQLPSPLSLAAANDPDTTQALAELLAQHLNLMGFNLHLGPSLEMAPTLDSATGTVYNFGSDPDFIGETFQITQRVFQEHGIVTVPLGFPGGGANRHKKSPAVLLTPPNLLDKLDLAPYKQAIEGGCPILHVGNTLVPTLDPSGVPACISKIVLGDMLRDKFAYEGIIMAGPMDSQDVAGIIDPAEAAIRALDYGADMILWSGADSREMRAVDKIVAAVHEERLSEAKIDVALKRVLTYKFEHLAQIHEALKSRQTKPLEYNKKLANKIKSIEQKSITVVKNFDNILPLRKNKSMPVGVTGTIGVKILRDGLEKHFKPISQQLITTARYIGEIQDFEIQRITSRIRGLRTVICVFGETNRPAGQRKLIRELKAKGAQVVVVHLGYPRNLSQLALADAIVLAYCDSENYDETLASMADVLVGEGPVGFIDINKDITVKVGESRTFNARDIVRVPAGRLPLTLSPEFPVGLSIPCDPQFAMKKVLWKFGDGSKSKGQRTVHAYREPGRYPVSLSVTGPNGSSSHYTFHIVANAVE